MGPWRRLEARGSTVRHSYGERQGGSPAWRRSAGSHHLPGLWPAFWPGGLTPAQEEGDEIKGRGKRLVYSAMAKRRESSPRLELL